MGAGELARAPKKSCFQTVVSNHQKSDDFTENGGIRERMTAARLGRRQTQNQEIAALKAENARLKAEIARIRSRLG